MKKFQVCKRIDKVFWQTLKTFVLNVHTHKKNRYNSLYLTTKVGALGALRANGQESKWARIRDANKRSQPAIARQIAELASVNTVHTRRTGECQFSSKQDVKLSLPWPSANKSFPDV